MDIPTPYRGHPTHPARTRDSHPGRDLVPGILTHCGQTNACESITFPLLRWRAVKMGSIPILCVLCRRHHTMLKFDSNVDFDALCLKYFRFRLPLPLSVINHIAIWLILEKRYKIYIYNFYVHHGITIWQICTNWLNLFIFIQNQLNSHLTDYTQMKRKRNLSCTESIDAKSERALSHTYMVFVFKYFLTSDVNSASKMMFWLLMDFKLTNK